MTEEEGFVVYGEGNFHLWEKGYSYKSETGYCHTVVEILVTKHYPLTLKSYPLLTLK